VFGTRNVTWNSMGLSTVSDDFFEDDGVFIIVESRVSKSVGTSGMYVSVCRAIRNNPSTT